jgi:uncharacterized protein (DUF2267 family)
VSCRPVVLMEHRHVDEAALVDRISALTGITEVEPAQRVGRVVTSVLMEQLSTHDRAWLAGELPAAWPLEATLGRAAVRTEDKLEDFYARVAAREGAELGLAREHAQCCCRALAEAFGDETRRHLTSRLSDDLAQLFELPEGHEPSSDAGGHHRARRERSTLSEGRPSSRHPISGAVPPPRAQQDSVTRSDNPHADTKLSSSRGTTQEREDETLAKGQTKP